MPTKPQIAQEAGKTLLEKARAYVEKHQIRPQSELVAFMAAFAQQMIDEEREHNIPWNNILHHAAAIRSRGEKGSGK